MLPNEKSLAAFYLPLFYHKTVNDVIALGVNYLIELYILFRPSTSPFSPYKSIANLFGLIAEIVYNFMWWKRIGFMGRRRFDP